jgi:hypothetical protein
MPGLTGILPTKPTMCFRERYRLKAGMTASMLMNCSQVDVDDLKNASLL